MKKYITLLLLVLVTVSCQQKFKEHWDLALDRESIVVSSTTQKITITVYCSGEWTIQLLSGADWLSVDKLSGSGVTAVHLTFEPNPGLSRQAVLEVRSAGLSKQLTIVQYPGVALPVVKFAKDVTSYPSASYALSLPFDTNIPKEYFEEAETLIEYVEGDPNWLTDVTIVPTEDPSPEEAGLPDGKRFFMNLVMKANLGGQPRQAKVVLKTGDGFGDEYKDSLLVNQSSYEPFINLPVQSDLVSRDGVIRVWRLDTNLADALNDAIATVTYPTGDAPFLTEVSLINGYLNYRVLDNNTGARRKAVVQVVSRDLNGHELSSSLTLEQKMEVPISLTMSELRSRFPSGGTFQDEHGSESFIEGLIECDYDYANIDQNLQYGETVEGYRVTAIDTSATGQSPNANNIFTTENDRTNYIQDVEGVMGMRLKFRRAQDNVFHRGEKVKVFLNNVKVIAETDPTRYTLADVSNIEVVSNTGSLPSKVRSVAQLTDNDIYTTVTLSDVEFQIKRGAYANVREYDAIENPVNQGLSPSINQARRGKDGAANLLYDKSGNAIYMLMNMNCAWRWDSSFKRRKQVPQGTGTMTGVIVHQNMERWGGNVGRYSIRPMRENDIVMGTTSSSGFKSLVEWTFTRKNWSVNQYSWNDNTTTLGGYVATGKHTDAELVQEVLNANEIGGMINNTGGPAKLYSENVMQLERSGDGEANYPVRPGWGYRGFDVSDYTNATISNGVDQTFGMSAGSIIQYMLNPSGFYVWDSSNNWTGATKGIVAEFSTEGKSASSVAISFSVACGVINRTVANISWTNAYSFPLDWTVEYATSTDGSTWSSWSKATNAATGETDFEMRSVPFSVSDAVSYTSFHSNSTSTFYTNSDCGFGLVPYRYTLPASVMNKKLVRVRLRPTSLRMAAWNPGSSNWNKGMAFRNEKITRTFEATYNHYTSVCLEDVLIQYK